MTRTSLTFITRSSETTWTIFRQTLRTRRSKSTICNRL